MENKTELNPLSGAMKNFNGGTGWYRTGGGRRIGGVPPQKPRRVYHKQRETTTESLSFQTKSGKEAFSPSLIMILKNLFIYPSAHKVGTSVSIPSPSE